METTPLEELAEKATQFIEKYVAIPQMEVAMSELLAILPCYDKTIASLPSE